MSAVASLPRSISLIASNADLHPRLSLITPGLTAMSPRSFLVAIASSLALAPLAAQAEPVHLTLTANFNTLVPAYNSNFYGPPTSGTTLTGTGDLWFDVDPSNLQKYSVHTQVSGNGFSTEPWYVLPLTDVTKFSFTVGKVSWNLADLTVYSPNLSTLDSGIYLADTVTSPYAVALTAKNAAGDLLRYSLNGCANNACALDANQMTFIDPANSVLNFYAGSTSVSAVPIPVQPAPVQPAPPAQVPEPGSLALLLGGLTACIGLNRRKVLQVGRQTSSPRL